VAQRKMKTDFQDCAAKLSEEFEDTKENFPGPVYVQEAACNLFSKTVKQCGRSWKKCYSEEEVQQLENMYLESLLVQYKDIQLEHCQVVLDYMKSEKRNKISQHQEKCDQESTLQAQNNFQMCSQTSSTKAYEKMFDVEDKTRVKNILCDTLKTITNVCKEHLEDCFSGEDIEIMNESNVEQMKTFLIRIARGKVKKNALDDCDTNDVKQVYDEKEQDTTEEIKSLDRSFKTGTSDSPVARNIIHRENDKSQSLDPVHEDMTQEKSKIENTEKHEKHEKSKDIQHAKTTDSTLRGAYKTEGQSSAGNISLPRIIIFIIIFIFPY